MDTAKLDAIIAEYKDDMDRIAPILRSFMRALKKANAPGGIDIYVSRYGKLVWYSA